MDLSPDAETQLWSQTGQKSAAAAAISSARHARQDIELHFLWNRILQLERNLHGGHGRAEPVLAGLYPGIQSGIDQVRAESVRVVDKALFLQPGGD